MSKKNDYKSLIEWRLEKLSQEYPSEKNTPGLKRSSSDTYVFKQNGGFVWVQVYLNQPGGHIYIEKNGEKVF